MSTYLCAYYQDPDVILKSNLTDLIVCSVHFGMQDSEPYIHLNDSAPDSEVNQVMWRSALASQLRCHVMIGGAGKAFQTMFGNNMFATYFELLARMLDEYAFIGSVDLDVEEDVFIDDVVVLIQSLKSEFPMLKVTMSCLAMDLVYPHNHGIGGFCYTDLVAKVGDQIDMYHAQAYDDSFSVEALQAILNQNLIPVNKLCFGMMSSQTTSALRQVYNMSQLGLAGFFVWNYHDMPPNWPDQILAAQTTPPPPTNIMSSLSTWCSLL